MENRPPDVFPYESDNSVSDSSSEEISDYNEHENPSRKTKVNSDCQEGKAVCDSDSEPSSGEISESDMEGRSDNGEDCVEFVRAVPTQRFSTINREPHSKDCDVKEGIPEHNKHFAIQSSLLLKHSSSSHHERTCSFFWK